MFIAAPPSLPWLQISRSPGRHILSVIRSVGCHSSCYVPVISSCWVEILPMKWVKHCKKRTLAGTRSTCLCKHFVKFDPASIIHLLQHRFIFRNCSAFYFHLLVDCHQTLLPVSTMVDSHQIWLSRSGRDRRIVSDLEDYAALVSCHYQSLSCYYFCFLSLLAEYLYDCYWGVVIASLKGGFEIFLADDA